MDNLTHSLVGLALSRAGLNRVCPRATLIAVLAANAADIDIVALAGGQATYLHYHRHFTHALVMVPAMALLGLLVARLLAGHKKAGFSWRRGYLVAFVAAAMHPLLDWTNVYGVRMLLPFSDDWLRLDIANVFDIWVWAALILAALGTGLSRLVSSEIGARPGSGRGLAIFALCFVMLYGYGRYVLHQRAVAALESRIYDGAAPLRVAAFPGPVNPLEWRGLVESADSYSLLSVNLLRELDPNSAHKLYKPAAAGPEQTARNAAVKTDAFRAFLEFSQYPLWRFSPSSRPEGLRVEAMDLRFGTPPEPNFVATAIVDARFRVLKSWFEY